MYTHTHVRTTCVCPVSVTMCRLLPQCYNVQTSDAANFGYAFEVQTTARTHQFVSERCALLSLPSHPGLTPHPTPTLGGPD